MTTIITIKEGSDQIGGGGEWEVDSGPFGHDLGGEKPGALGLARQAGHGKSGIDWGAWVETGAGHRPICQVSIARLPLALSPTSPHATHLLPLLPPPCSRVGSSTHAPAASLQAWP